MSCSQVRGSQRIVPKRDLRSCKVLLSLKKMVGGKPTTPMTPAAGFVSFMTRAANTSATHMADFYQHTLILGCIRSESCFIRQTLLICCRMVGKERLFCCGSPRTRAVAETARLPCGPCRDKLRSAGSKPYLCFSLHFLLFVVVQENACNISFPCESYYTIYTPLSSPICYENVSARHPPLRHRPRHQCNHRTFRPRPRPNRLQWKHTAAEHRPPGSHRNERLARRTQRRRHRQSLLANRPSLCASHWRIALLGIRSSRILQSASA